MKKAFTAVVLQFRCRSGVYFYCDLVCKMTTLQVLMNHARIVIEKQEVFVKGIKAELEITVNIKHCRRTKFDQTKCGRGREVLT